MGPLVKYYAISCLVLILMMMGTPCLALAGSKYQRPLSRWTVGVVNKLGVGQTLSVHCKSKDDDLGDRQVKAGESFSWSFKENIWSSTLYWCSLRTPANKHASFEVFWREKHEWLAYRCNFKSCIWVAQDDGIYLLNIPEGTPELVHKWEQ